MTFQADYPGAIVVEAANYGYTQGAYSLGNQPVTWCFHTPEEPADSHPSTPDYLATTDRDASYTYFVSYLGFVFQLVPEDEGAYGNALEGKPAPHWSDGSNLNLQTLSVSFEGYTSTIHQTMPRGCPQWNAGVNLVAHRTLALRLHLDWAIQHKDVSIHRGDCGQWDQGAFLTDVVAKMQEDDEMTPEEKARLAALEAWQRDHAPGLPDIVRDADTDAAFVLKGKSHHYIPSEVWEAAGRDPAVVVTVPHATIIAQAPTRGPDATVDDLRG
jgi:hypothetical protein